MWIRSQDLYTLIKCERFSVRQCASKNYCVIGDEQIVLGEYSKVDKALKVLDEIQRKVEYPGSTLLSPTSLKNYYHLTPTGQFYQMPQDEEVEENG